MCSRHDASHAHTAPAPVSSTRRSLSASIAVETCAFRIANSPPKPQHSVASSSGRRSTPAPPATATPGRSPHLQQPKRVTGRVVGERAHEPRADVHGTPRRSTRNSDSSHVREATPPESTVSSGTWRAHVRHARPRRRDHRLEAVEHLHEPLRQRRRHVRVARVQVQLAAARLRPRELDLHPRAAPAASPSRGRPPGAACPPGR